MKRILLISMCLVLALSGVALAQVPVTISGQTLAFGVFGAIGGQVTAVEQDHATPVGDYAYPFVITAYDGSFSFLTNVMDPYYRHNCEIKAVADYFGGVLHLLGTSAPFDVAASGGGSAVCITVPMFGVY